MQTLKQYIQEKKYWISPRGKFHTTDDHEDFAFNNIVDADEIMEKYPEYGEEDTVDNENGREQIFSDAETLGWVPIHIEKNAVYFMQGWKTIPYNIRKEIKDFAIEHNYEIMDYYNNVPISV